MKYLYPGQRIHVILIVAFTLLNLIAFNLFVKTGAYDKSGQFIFDSSSEVFVTSLLSILLIIPIIGVVAGALAAMLPFKNLLYPIRFLRSALLAGLIANAFMTFSLILIIILTLTGQYPQKTKLATPDEQAEGIAAFHQQIYTFQDSAHYHIDQALNSLADGVPTHAVKEQYQSAIESFQKEINLANQNFLRIALDLNLNQQQYKQVFIDLSPSMRKLSIKYEQLRTSGIEINLNVGLEEDLEE